MHIFTALIFATSFFTLSPTSAYPTGAKRQTERLEGVAVSHYQEGEIDWSGSSFGYVEASAANNFVSPTFNNQLSECEAGGLVCGAYHVAVPALSTGTDQAQYFINNGGNWTAGTEKKLPGGLVIGYDYEATGCFDLDPPELVKWVRDFSDEYHRTTGRYPVLGTSYAWWSTCTNNDATFNTTHALALLGPDTVPGGWGSWSFLQQRQPDTEQGGLFWHADQASLEAFAKGAN